MHGMKFNLSDRTWPIRRVQHHVAMIESSHRCAGKIHQFGPDANCVPIDLEFDEPYMNWLISSMLGFEVHHFPRIQNV